MRHIPDALNVGAVTNTLPVVIDQDVTVVYGGAYTLLINWNSEYDALIDPEGKKIPANQVPVAEVDGSYYGPVLSGG